jgi:ligand-binding sensor domain-containing protein
MTLSNGIVKQLLLLQLLFLKGQLFICFSQPSFRFEHFTTEQGLSENFIYSIIQDSKGYLWIGTHDGLNRYDGYSFKKYRHNPADSNSLPNNTINSICEDGNGNIWIGTNGGLCRYNPTENLFTKIQLRKKTQDIIQLLQSDDNGIPILRILKKQR